MDLRLLHLPQVPDSLAGWAVLLGMAVVQVEIPEEGFHQLGRLPQAMESIRLLAALVLQTVRVQLPTEK